MVGREGGGGHLTVLGVRKIGVFCRQVAFLPRVTHYSVAV